MPDRTIVITGASDGIGAVAARELARAGERVVVVGRSPDKTRAVAEEIGAPAYVCDFADLGQVRALAEQLRAAHPRIDVLVNNAGAIMGGFERTVDGHEKTLQVNHLAPFLLTNLLLDQLVSSHARVINTASTAAKRFGSLDLDNLENERGYDAIKAYGDAKLDNILFTRELHRRYGAHGIATVAFHPGNVASNFASDTTSSWRFIYNTPLRHLMLISPRRGAQPLLRLAEGRPGVDWQSGAFYVKTKIASSGPQADDASLAAALWNRSAEMVGLPAAA
jgi:NAD(P)-dependent dehydrogenase (short-subunit alcohol dehydrogenase family)